MRTICLVVVLLAVSACSGRRPPAEALPASPLARAAIAEWEAWGRIVIIGWPDEPPADSAATPERFARLLDYWGTIPGGGRVATRLLGLRSGVTAMADRITAEMPGDDGTDSPRPNAPRPPEDISLYDYPAWSAAFISTVARRAGVPESDLPSSSRHARYIDAVLRRAITDPEHAAFSPHAPEEQAPVPGDLLCADRAYVPLDHWTRRLAETGRPRPMHCDVVVRTRPGVIEAIGGNVRGTVALRQFPSDATGRVLPAPPGRPSFVLLLVAREEGGRQ
ncbi:DUF2272 domain-containing protein [Roseomonas sp. CAU 1739]|uniref:DUF2272 domain-containing protein n=1 Tax=Roseomonas sp. CAU 1739 TaxID=3140364 RepID=UPI00325A896B